MHLTELERLAGSDIHRTPERNVLAIERRGHSGARQCDRRIRPETQHRSVQRHFERGCIRPVAAEAVCQPVRQPVHRPGRRHADIPIADAARPVLQARLRAGREHVDGRALITVAGERRGKEPAVEEFRRARERAQIVEIGLDAVDTRLIERRSELCRGLFARFPLHDHLGQHRIVERRHFRARRDPAVDAHAVRKGNLREKTGRRLEIAAGIFCIKPHLEGVALGRTGI